MQIIVYLFYANIDTGASSRPQIAVASRFHDVDFTAGWPPAIRTVSGHHPDCCNKLLRLLNFLNFFWELLTRPNPISSRNSGASLNLSVCEAKGVDSVQASGGDWVQNVLRIASAHAAEVRFLGATDVHAILAQI
jgi:hypothetical protein